jgi:hypothetical protein
VDSRSTLNCPPFDVSLKIYVRVCVCVVVRMYVCVCVVAHAYASSSKGTLVHTQAPTSSLAASTHVPSTLHSSPAGAMGSTVYSASVYAFVCVYVCVCDDACEDS